MAQTSPAMAQTFPAMAQTSPAMAQTPQLWPKRPSYGPNVPSYGPLSYVNNIKSTYDPCLSDKSGGPAPPCDGRAGGYSHSALRLASLHSARGFRVAVAALPFRRRNSWTLRQINWTFQRRNICVLCVMWTVHVTIV